MVLLLLTLTASLLPAQRVPTIDDLLSLPSIASPALSPNGQYAAYTVTETDWEQDATITHIWLIHIPSKRHWQLTRGPKSSSQPAWSPDSHYLAFTSDREANRSQLYAIRPDGGEALRLTNSDTPIASFAWSPDSQSIAYLATPKPAEDRKKKYGDYEVVRRDYQFSHLFTIHLSAALKSPANGLQRTTGANFSINGFQWSPDARHIAFHAARNPDLVQRDSSDIYLLTLDGNTVRKIVDSPGPDSNPHFSPDGQSILFLSSMASPKHFHANAHLAIVPTAGGDPRLISKSFDEDPIPLAWTKTGIYFTGYLEAKPHLFRIDPATFAITRLSTTPASLFPALNKDATQVLYAAPSATTLTEIYLTPVSAWKPQALTSYTEKVRSWILPNDEIIRWKSRDGATITGVLSKPHDFDPKRRYPLLCVIHGGPTGLDVPARVHPRYYPIDLWTARGALVLRVNYRGSAGFGEKFRQLNVGNLGVGDAWDVESGVDHLIAQGHVDPAKVGVMGWSQGGYISAFLTASSTKFAAVSVGAGISNWATYYYNTDITPFTIQYLGDNPVNNPEIYRKTSPMSYIRQAKTPTLIQHGELDKRVPIPNAYELRQALEDRAVPVEMIVYKGFGHGITKPKSQRAVMQHNLLWFNHYIFGDPAPDLTNP